jgi:hypothetical protein
MRPGAIMRRWLATVRCFLFHRAYWRTRHGIMRECIRCETLTIVGSQRHLAWMSVGLLRGRRNVRARVTVAGADMLGTAMPTSRPSMQLRVGRR